MYAHLRVQKWGVGKCAWERPHGAAVAFNDVWTLRTAARGERRLLAGFCQVYGGAPLAKAPSSHIPSEVFFHHQVPYQVPYPSRIRSFSSIHPLYHTPSLLPFLQSTPFPNPALYPHQRALSPCGTEVRWLLSDVVGAEDGLGVECLSGSAAIATAYCRAFREGCAVCVR